MDLLQKFAEVEVKADQRITAMDKNYCEQHQKAYETAIISFRELKYFWGDMNAAQKKLLGDTNSPFYHDYLVSHEGPSISEQSINRHIEALHNDFIRTVTWHFNSTYHVSVDASDVSDVLLPKRPDRHWRSDSEEVHQKYHEQMQSLMIHYQDVVDQIILRLDGRSFLEQTFYELSSKCHNAAWNSFKREAEYTQKNDTIQFSERFCTFRGWPYDGWGLHDRMKDILRGLAHFETDSYGVLPVGFSPLLGYADIKEPVVEFPACEKLKQIKFFKNGRVDLKFQSAEFAGQFISKYLGAIY